MLNVVRLVRSELAGEVAGFDAHGLSEAELMGLVEELGGVRRLVDAAMARVSHRLAQTSVHLAAGERTAAHLVSRVTGVEIAEIQRGVDTVARLASLPEVDAAIRAGRLSGRQADLITTAAVANPGAAGPLLDTATQGISRLRDACVAARAAVEDASARAARQQASRCLRTWTGIDGMIEGRFSLTPEIGAGVLAVIDAETRRILRTAHPSGIAEPMGCYAADAFAGLITSHAASVLGSPHDANAVSAQAGHLESARPRRVAHQVHVLVDLAVLQRGSVLPGETCEIPGVGPVNAEWVRALVGDAFLTAVIRNGKDITTIAHFGRHIPAELRTALIVTGHECAVCPARGYLEVDHSTVDVARDGPTAWWNLQWLCALHHRLKTRGWTLGPIDPRTGKATINPPRPPPPAQPS